MSLDARLGRGRLGFTFIIVLFDGDRCLGITVADATEKPNFEHILKHTVKMATPPYIITDSAVKQLVAGLESTYNKLQST